MGASHPDLFSARSWFCLPIDGLFHRFAHLVKPPLRSGYPGDLPVLGRVYVFCLQAKFKLCVGRHNMSFL